jgi:site-specific DNA recombinase
MIAESRSTAGERRHTHPHYLKGSIYCRRSHRRHVQQRLVIQHTTNSRGSTYQYFFCVNKRTGECTMPHINTTQVEDAVERVYGAVRFSRQFIEQTRSHMVSALSNHQRSARLLKQQLQSELKALDVKENNLLDLAADGSTAQSKIKERLRGIELQRSHLRERLGEEVPDLTDDAPLIELGLVLLEDPRRSTAAATTTRSDYSTRPSSTGSTSMRTRLPGTNCVNRSRPYTPSTPARPPRTAPASSRPLKPAPDAKMAAPVAGNHQSASNHRLRVLLTGDDLAGCSNKTRLVELRGFEPLATSLRTRGDMVMSGHPGLAQVVAGTPWPVLVGPVAALYCCTPNPEPADSRRMAAVRVQPSCACAADRRICPARHVSRLASFSVVHLTQRTT